jgi:tartrate-resistant acid phosphatase type 5
MLLLLSHLALSVLALPKKESGSVGSDTLSFLVLGDWGEPTAIPSEKQVARQMNNVADKYNSRFVISVGDNFYKEGITTARDDKWNTLWMDVYTDTIGVLPWFGRLVLTIAVLGNHDWYGSPSGQIAYSRQNPRWVMPDYFYDNVVSFGSRTAAFVYIDTNLINYGYSGESDRPTLNRNFADMGWTAGSNVINEQLALIDAKLAEHADKDYIFIVGHHVLRYSV